MKSLKFYFLSIWVFFMATSLSAEVIKVNAGDDIRLAIRKATADDIIYLEPGEHKIPGQIDLNKDITMTGDPENMPVVYFANFIPSGGGQKLTLENLHIIFERKYLIYSANDKECDIKDIIIRNCVINLNGEVGSSVILNRSTAKNNRIGNILIDNCIVYNAQSASHGLINVNKESTVQIASVTIKNSTFSDFMRGVIIVGAPMDNLKIDISNCTFYNINTSENPGAIIHAREGNTEIKVDKSLFHLAGSSPKLIDAGSGGIVSVTASYAVKAQPKVRNPYGLKTLKGDARTVFASPDNDPLDGCTSFRVIDKEISGSGIGDPRWK